METRTIELETPDGPMPLYEAREDWATHALVVVQEAFGVNGHIEDVTRRFADLGYHAVAPHLHHRSGGGTVAYGDMARAREHQAELDDDRLLADVDAALAHLAAAGWGAPQTGVVGFCFGGRVSFLVAVERPLGGAVGFYGGGIVTARNPRFPALVDRAPFLKTPWLGLFGELDTAIPLDDVERLRTELATAPVDAELVVYPGAKHGFFCDERPSFDPEVAEAGWQRAVDWLETHVRRRTR